MTASAHTLTSTPVPTSPGEPGPQWWVIVTDEELAALDGPDQGVVGLPQLSVLAPDVREAVLDAARRSLQGRGLLPGFGAPTETTIPAPLGDLLAVRRAPQAVLVLQRLLVRDTGPEVTWRYVHARAGLAVIEDVDADGFHLLGCAPLTDLSAALTRFLVPESAGQANGGRPAPASLRIGSPEAESLLAGALVVADVFVRCAAEDDPRHAGGPDSTHALFVLPGAVYGGPSIPPTGRPVEVALVGDVGAWLHDLVSDAQARGEAYERRPADRGPDPGGGGESGLGWAPGEGPAARAG